MRKTSTTVSQSHATTGNARMESPPSPASARPDTQAPSVISKCRSATVIRVRTEAAALTWSMPTSVTVPLESQVGSQESVVVGDMFWGCNTIGFNTMAQIFVFGINLLLSTLTNNKTLLSYI